MESLKNKTLEQIKKLTLEKKTIKAENGKLRQEFEHLKKEIKRYGDARTKIKKDGEVLQSKNDTALKDIEEFNKQKEELEEYVKDNLFQEEKLSKGQKILFQHDQPRPGE